MKSYNEMAESVLRRMDEYKVFQKRRRKKICRIVVSFCCICFVMLIGIVVWKNDIVLQEKPNDSFIVGEEDEEIMDVVVNMDSDINYDNIESMVNDADIIIKGVVISTSSYKRDIYVLTENKILVEEAFGNAEVGDTITIISAGGVISYGEYQNQSDENKKDFEEGDFEEVPADRKVRVQMGANDVITKGKTYIIFAQKNQVLDCNGNQKEEYCVLNIDQGQFEVCNDIVINKTFTEKYDLEELEEKIKECIKK